MVTSLGTAHATTYYWDVNGNGTGSGVTSTQHTWAAGFFSTDPNGLAGTGTTSTGNTLLPGANDDVVFSAGTDATIAYQSAVSGTTSVKGITLNTNGSGQLTLGGTTADLTIGAGGVKVSGGAASGTTTVLSITTSSSATHTLTIGAAQTWTIANGILNVSSNINYANQLTFGSGSFIIGSTGTSGAGLYSGAGGVRIYGGNVQLASPSGSPAINDFGSGILELSSGSLQEIPGASGTVTISNATSIDGSFTFATNGSKPLTFTNAVTISNTPTLSLSSGGGINFNGGTTLDSNVVFNGSTSGVTTFGGGIADDGNTRSVTFGGGGRYNLSAGSTYTGGTTISAGTVITSNTLGSATGTGSLTVSGTGLLGGSGKISTSGISSGTAVTIASGATLSPGGLSTTSTLTAPATVLTFNLQNGSSMQLNSGSNFVFDLGAMNVSDSVTPGTATSDLIRITGGTLNLNSIDLADFKINMLSGFNIGSYNLFAADAPGDITGTLGPLISEGFTFGGVPYGYTLAITNGGQDLTLIVVPEPNTWAMMLVGLGALIFYVRRRNLSGNFRV